MSAKVEAGPYRLDGLKWLVVFALIGGGAFANSYYTNDFALIYRALAMVVIGLLAAFVAFNTAKGHAFWSLAKEAQVEVRKVVWPTTAETNQTTMLVMVVVIITAILLWFFDWIISQLAQYILG